jgi:hypothetical protein
LPWAEIGGAWVSRREEVVKTKMSIHHRPGPSVRLPKGEHSISRAIPALR